MTNPGRPLITEIPIESIFPHPHNPRKNLGELSELANSIKQSGVLQNLTVIPGRFLHPDEYVDSLPGGADPREALDMLRADPSLAYDDTDSSYTVIIGHRRLAAARLAGLSTVPVAVVEMDFRTQLATMMAENVQRADLTPFEQADGFQLMMDLGMSADEVARETGFSVSTVRRRVKLTQLNREKLPDGAAPKAKPKTAAKQDKPREPETVQTSIMDAALAEPEGMKYQQIQSVDKAIDALNSARRSFYGGKDDMLHAAAALNTATAKADALEKKCAELDAKWDALATDVCEGFGNVLDDIDRITAFLNLPAVKRMCKRFGDKN